MTPTVYEPITQKSTEDCGVACLAMFLGEPYPVVREAVWWNLAKQGGSTIKQMVALAKQFGVKLEYEVFEEDGRHENVIGILGLERKRGRGPGHVVIWFKGLVWTTASGHLWTDLDAYLETCGFKVEGVLVRKDKEDS